jgi:hypothetical protein
MDEALITGHATEQKKYIGREPAVNIKEETAESKGLLPPSKKQKGPARTPPRNRQLAPLPLLAEQDIEEEFMRGAR